MPRSNHIKVLFTSSKTHRWLLLILLAAFVLRLVVALGQNPLDPYSSASGDSWWYLDHGLKLFHNAVNGPPQSAPLYLLWAGFWETVLPGAGAVIAMRLSQVVMATATCWFAYRLAKALTDDERAGLVAAGALAIAPVFVLETAQLLTETPYIFFVAGGLTAYVEMVKNPDPTTRRYARVILISLLLALATMTRAVLILFPLGLAIHLLLVYGWRRGLQYAVLLLTIYALVTSIWTIYNEERWHTPVIGAQGLSAFLLIGATEWTSPQDMDATLTAEAGGQLSTQVGDQQEVYANAAAEAISSNLPGWLARRVTKLAGAYLQPHGTIFFHGESLKSLAVDWLKHDRTPAGLLRLTQGDEFWPKLSMYLFHYTSLLAGIVGIWITRRKWRVALPLSGFILYTSLVHLFLEAIPRYLFPLSFVWWVFAAVTLVAIWDRVRRPHRNSLVSPVNPATDHIASV
ncbi:MAG: phospholipid carrier-dependent glycosyltransferase [Chloroflexota bacterium]